MHYVLITNHITNDISYRKQLVSHAAILLARPDNCFGFKFFCIQLQKNETGFDTDKPITKKVRWLC